MAGTKAWDMETDFSNAGVFVNGINNRKSHMDSYMTVMDFQVFDKTWEEIKDKYTRDEWSKACDYWLGMNYISPMAGLLARLVRRKLDVS